MSHLVERLRTASSLAQALPACREAAARIEQLTAALRFYADGRRYGGPNQRKVADDPWTKEDAAYMKDVTRDGGAIARDVLPRPTTPARATQRPVPCGEIDFEYTNWEGRKGLRRVRPVSIRFGKSEWHPKPQWLFLAFDIDKDAEREFAMADMAFDDDALAAFALSSTHHSPSPLQAPHNPGERLRNSDVAVGEGETPPARQENDDVFPGFRGNNDHA